MRGITVTKPAQFDELTPLHPHAVGLPAARIARNREVRVRRAASRGYYSSEFWLAALAVVAPVALALTNTDRRALRDIAIGGGIAAAGYALGRSYVKGTIASRA